MAISLLFLLELVLSRKWNKVNSIKQIKIIIVYSIVLRSYFSKVVNMILIKLQWKKIINWTDYDVYHDETRRSILV